MFLNYSSCHKGFLCLASTGKLYISRHVQFDDHVFPFQSNPNFVSSTVSTASPPITFVLAIHVLPCTNKFTPLATLPDFVTSPIAPEPTEPALQDYEPFMHESTATDTSIIEQQSNPPIVHPHTDLIADTVPN